MFKTTMLCFLHDYGETECWLYLPCFKICKLEAWNVKPDKLAHWWKYSSSFCHFLLVCWNYLKSHSSQTPNICPRELNNIDKSLYQHVGRIKLYTRCTMYTAIVQLGCPIWVKPDVGWVKRNPSLALLSCSPPRLALGGSLSSDWVTLDTHSMGTTVIPERDQQAVNPKQQRHICH